MTDYNIEALLEKCNDLERKVQKLQADNENLHHELNTTLCLLERKIKESNGAALSGESILKRLLVDGDLCIHPIIDLEKQIGPDSIDVRLGTIFLSERTTSLTQIDPLAPSAEIEYEMLKSSERYLIDPTDAYVLHPEDFALACTFEYVRIPPNLKATIQGRSSWARKGLDIHATASGIQPGFEGLITFELSNKSKLPIELYPMLRIGQLSFEPLDQPTALVYGKKRLSKYQGDLGPSSTRLHKDPEWWILKAQRESDQPGSSDLSRPAAAIRHYDSIP